MQALEECECATEQAVPEKNRKLKLGIFVGLAGLALATPIYSMRQSDSTSSARAAPVSAQKDQPGSKAGQAPPDKASCSCAHDEPEAAVAKGTPAH